MRKFKKHLLAIFITCLFVLAFSAIPGSAATFTELQPTLKDLSAIQGLTAMTTDVQTNLDYDVYLKLDGISGDTKAKNYENWIMLSSVQFEVANSGLGNSAGGGGGAGKADLKNFVVKKSFDSASVPLFMTAISGAHIKNGQIVFVKHSSSASFPFLTIDLRDLILSDYYFNNINETINIKFSSIYMSYSTTDSKGAKTPPISGGWNFIQNQKQ
jgi:type VI protein secretion system component Hcp